MAEKFRADASETAFVTKQLEYVKAKTYDVKYGDQRYSMLPLDASADEGAQTITYQSFDQVGQAKIIANYADDLPRCDVHVTETSINVKGIGDSYGYSLQDIRSARRAGVNLNTRKATTCRRAIEQKVNSLVWTADGSEGVTGLLYNSNITVNNAPTGTWSGATTAQILADLMYAIDHIVSATNGIEVPNTVLLPIDEYTLISSKPMQTGSDTTILEFFKTNRPGTTVTWLQELADMAVAPSGATNKNVMLAFVNDADHLTVEMPVPFEQLEPEKRNLEWVVDCHARCAGVAVYYPAAVHAVEGI